MATRRELTQTAKQERRFPASFRTAMLDVQKEASPLTFSARKKNNDGTMNQLPHIHASSKITLPIS